MNWLEKVPFKEKDLAWRMVEGEVLAVPLKHRAPDSEEIYIFNETASEVWGLIDGKNKISEIAEKLSMNYSAEPGKISTHIKNLIDEMFERKLIAFR